MEKKERTISLVGDFSNVNIGKSIITITLPSIECINILVDGEKQKFMPIEQKLEIKTDIKVIPKIGDKLTDGWIFLGKSPSTGKPYSLEPTDNYSNENQDFHTNHIDEINHERIHTNLRIPKIGELKDIFDKIVKTGNNEKTGIICKGAKTETTYWSSTSRDDGHEDNYQVCLDMYDGKEQDYYYSGTTKAKLLFVRDEPVFSM